LGEQATQLEVAAEAVAQVGGLWTAVTGAMRVDAALAGLGQEKLGAVEARLKETAGSLRCVRDFGLFVFLGGGGLSRGVVGGAVYICVCMCVCLLCDVKSSRSEAMGAPNSQPPHTHTKQTTTAPPSATRCWPRTTPT
jgi:hypothetical protein